MRLKMLFRAACLILPVAASPLFSGCVENRSSVFIAGATSVSVEDDCAFEPGADFTQVFRGRYDIAPGGPYVMALIVANQLQALGDNDTLRSETSHIQIEGAEVRLESLDGGSVPGGYTVPFTSVIAPTRSETPGFGGAAFPAIPAGAITQPGTYIVHVRVFGTTMGGVAVESGEFSQPIDVCEGCLATCDREDELACSSGVDLWTHCSRYPGGCAACP